MIRPQVLVVENEPTQARALTECLLRFGLYPLGPVATTAEALELCQHDWPDLVVLGLQPANASASLELAQQLSRLRSTPTVFLYEDIEDGAILEQMAQMQPLAALPRPYRAETLQRIILQGLTLAASMGTVPLPMPSASELSDPVNPWLYVRERGMLVRITLMDIACVYMEHQYAILVMTSGRRYSVRLTLAEVLSTLSVSSFVQCHRSWIVNMQHIERVDPTADTAWLVGGAEAALGRAYRQRVLQQLTILG